MKIMTLQNVWSHVFYLFSRKKNSILQISMLPCLKISFKTCLSHYWYLVIRKSLILSQVSHRGSGLSVGVTGKNVRKFLWEWSTKICVHLKRKNMEYLKNFLTFLNRIPACGLMNLHLNRWTGVILKCVA